MQKQQDQDLHSSSPGPGSNTLIPQTFAKELFCSACWWGVEIGQEWAGHILDPEGALTRKGEGQIDNGAVAQCYEPLVLWREWCWDSVWKQQTVECPAEVGSEWGEGEGRGKGHKRQTGRQERSLLIPGFLSPCCVAFGKILTFCEPQLPHMQNGDGSDSAGLLGDRSETLLFLIHANTGLPQDLCTCDFLSWISIPPIFVWATPLL